MGFPPGLWCKTHRGPRVGLSPLGQALDPCDGQGSRSGRCGRAACVLHPGILGSGHLQFGWPDRPAFACIHSLDGSVPNFPPAYPTGVLLGCVDVVDVLPASTLERWPGLPESCRLEASAPFCFLCQNPKRLVVPQQLKGQQRIWQLPRAILKIALQGLRDPPGLPPFSWRDFGEPSALLSLPPAVSPPVAGGGTQTKTATAAQPRSIGHGKVGRTGSDDG
ncbi:hypothetical protein VaNZ11_010511 [Volvox africanus]|uniref:Uncharacterized protein n=1 Tax=Volvox africanus TaxID=51714 RepID=A0ABQ5SBM0_9CHLO|nr:hypothetical protein VaNZ11_010511 [Volvox africanus]